MARFESKRLWLSVGWLLLGCGQPTPGPQLPSVASSVTRPAACEGAIVASDTLDINLSLPRLRGAVTVNGQPLAELSSGASRGSLVFFDVERGASLRLDLGRTSNGAFDILIARGTYQVWFSPSGCYQNATVPCTPALLERELRVESDATRTFNIEAVRLTLAMTIDGVPSTEGRAGFVLANEYGSTLVVSAPREPVTYLVTRGTYKFVYKPYGSTPVCRDASGPSPCNAAIVREGIAVDRDLSLAIDVPTTVLTLTATSDTAPAPIDATSGGSLSLQSGSLDPTEVTSLGTGSASNVATIRVVRGRYDVAWERREGVNCAADSVVPCNSGRFATLDVRGATQSETVTMNTVAARGAVTINSSPVLIPSATTAPRVFAIDVARKQVFPTTVGADGRYTLRLLRGSRVGVGYESSSSRCSSSTGPIGTGVFCGAAELSPTTTFDSDRTLDAALTGHQIELAISIDGAPRPPSLSPSQVQMQLIPERIGSFVGIDPNTRFVTLIDGSYRLAIGTILFACSESRGLPCGLNVVPSPIDVRADVAVPIEIRTRRLTGTVLINGAAPTAAGLTTAAFVGFFGASASATVVPYGNSTPMVYEARMIDSPFVGFVTTAAPCSIDEPVQGSRVCGTVFFLGCGR